MKQLGYPATWPTRCFLRDDCNDEVWAHTNGYGDFVLFDRLGWPWPVHECYLNRFVTRLTAHQPITLADDTSWQQLRQNLSSDYLKMAVELKAPMMRQSPDTRRADPENWLPHRTFDVSGYVQDYVENRMSKLLNSSGEVVRQAVAKIIGTRNSQITLITPDNQSFTMIADLSRIVISIGSLAAAKLRVVRIPLLKGLPIAFICDSLHILELAPPRRAHLA